MNDEVECNKCKGPCIIDGEFPKFFAWCETCRAYAEEFDFELYAAEYMANKIDYVCDTMKDKE